MITPKFLRMPAEALTVPKSGNPTAFISTRRLMASVGAGKAILADATNQTKPALFFVSGTNKVKTGGRHATLKIETGITISAMDRLWLSKTTPGAVTNVPPAAAGNIQQLIGYAMANGTGAGGTVDAAININYDYTLI